MRRPPRRGEEEKKMGKRIADLFRRDVVLCVSFLLAAVSCAVSPPSAAYLGYIDFDTLITLFCLMLIVAGLGRQNFLRYIAGKLLAGARSARGLVLILVLLCFVLPAVLSWVINLGLRKLGWVKDGDMKLDL